MISLGPLLLPFSLPLPPQEQIFKLQLLTGTLSELGVSKFLAFIHEGNQSPQDFIESFI